MIRHDSEQNVQAPRKKKLPFRYVICLLGSIGLGIIYGLKVNFHVTIVSMVNYTALGEKTEHSEEDGPFVWSPLIQGLLLSSYFWGYIIAELPSGRIAEDYSAKWVLFFGVAVNVCGALLSPVAAEWHYSVLLIIRVLQGIGGGVSFPGMHCILSHWAPPEERGFMSSIVYSGIALGTVAMMLLSGLIAYHLGWQYVFYIEGGACALWLIFWAIFGADTPLTHKFVSDAERKFIASALHETNIRRHLKLPWKSALTSPPFIAILVAHTCNNWGWYMVLVELPLYMKTVLQFALENNALLTALPFLTMWVFSMVFSELMDHLIHNGKITTTLARKIATGVSSIGPLICFILLGFFEDALIGVLLMTFAVTFLGAMFSGFLANHIDISPHFAGTLVGITNSVATIPGIVVPFVVSTLTESDPTLGSWRIIFWITAGFYIIEFVVYTTLSSGEAQPWDPVIESRSQSIAK